MVRTTVTGFFTVVPEGFAAGFGLTVRVPVAPAPGAEAVFFAAAAGFFAAPAAAGLVADFALPDRAAVVPVPAAFAGMRDEAVFFPPAPASARRRSAISSSMALRFDLTTTPISFSLATASEVLRFSSLAI